MSLSWLQRTAERLGGPGRNGAAVLRDLLVDRGPSAAPTESALEDMLVQWLRRAGLPERVRQYWVRGRGMSPVRVDLAYPHARVAVEADSRLWHSGREDVQRNAQKRNALVALGWRLLCFTRADVRRRQAYVVETVTGELARPQAAG